MLNCTCFEHIRETLSAPDVCPNGGLAQLGERLAGSQKVIGSSPLSSTPKAFCNNELRKAFLLVMIK